MSTQPESSRFLYFTTISVNLISFAAGTAFAWSSPSLPRLDGTVDPSHNPLSTPITQYEQSLIASLIAIGGIFGPFVAAYLCDKLGRKKALLLSAAPLYMSFIIIAVADRTWHFYLARFLAGFSIGMFFVILPNYIAEISQKHNRGALSCFLTVNIAMGNLFIYCIGPFLQIKYVAMICLIAPTVFYVLVGMYVLDSPYFSLRKGDDGSATALLSKLRDGRDVVQELTEIKNSIQEAYANKTKPMDLFTDSVLLKSMIIAFGLIFFQQFAGVNAILFYMQTIFTASGSDMPAEISTIIIGCVQLAASIVTPFLVDKFGRRFLLLLSAAGCVISLSAMGIFFYISEHQLAETASISWLPTCSLVGFMVTFNMGFGPIPWMVLSEIFPPNFSGLASMIAVPFCFLFCFISTAFFPVLCELIGAAMSFWMFAAFCLVSCFFIYFLLPETKGKSLSEIQRILSQ